MGFKNLAFCCWRYLLWHPAVWGGEGGGLDLKRGRHVS
jgi:hypothetical protein